jgi:hypothetical protein
MQPGAAARALARRPAQRPSLPRAEGPGWWRRRALPQGPSARPGPPGGRGGGGAQRDKKRCWPAPGQRPSVQAASPGGRFPLLWARRSCREWAGRALLLSALLAAPPSAAGGGGSQPQAGAARWRRSRVCCIRAGRQAGYAQSFRVHRAELASGLCVCVCVCLGVWSALAVVVSWAGWLAVAAGAGGSGVGLAGWRAAPAAGDMPAAAAAGGGGRAGHNCGPQAGRRGSRQAGLAPGAQSHSQRAWQGMVRRGRSFFQPFFTMHVQHTKPSFERAP